MKTNETNKNEMKNELRKLLYDQLKLLKLKPMNEHAYYIEQFQSELADLINPRLHEDDTYPDDFYLTLHSLFYFEFLIDELLNYKEEE